MNNLSDIIDRCYEELEGNESVESYHDRHGTESMGILTIYDDERAWLIAERLRPRIEGKFVVEIGGGIGLLALHLAEYAKQVISFEVDPMWVSCCVHVIYAKKPRNVTYIFGAAQDFAVFRADVALFCTHSGHESLRRIGRMFAPEVIDVYGEIVGPTELRRLDEWPELKG